MLDSEDVDDDPSGFAVVVSKKCFECFFCLYGCGECLVGGGDRDIDCHVCDGSEGIDADPLRGFRLWGSKQVRGVDSANDVFQTWFKAQNPWNL